MTDFQEFPKVVKHKDTGLDVIVGSPDEQEAATGEKWVAEEPPEREILSDGELAPSKDFEEFPKWVEDYRGKQVKVADAAEERIAKSKPTPNLPAPEDVDPNWTKARLVEFANSNRIELGDASTKAKIMDVITAALGGSAEPPPAPAPTPDPEPEAEPQPVE